MILRGNYPEIASRRSVDRQLWCGSYISTYLERDVRSLALIGDLSHFERFLKLCAVRTGQLLNLSELAKEIGMSVPTLASYLLGLHDRETLMNSPHFGNLFETMVVIDFLKRFLHSGQMPSMYYLRTRDGLEIDLVLELGQKLHLFEIKSTMTMFPKHASPLFKIASDLGTLVRSASIISQSPDNLHVKNGIYSYNWKNVLGT